MSAAERCGWGLASRSRTCRISTSAPEKQLATVRTACSASRDLSTARRTFTESVLLTAWLSRRKIVRGRLGRYPICETRLAHHNHILGAREPRSNLDPHTVINVSLDGDLSS